MTIPSPREHLRGKAHKHPSMPKESCDPAENAIVFGSESRTARLMRLNCLPTILDTIV